MARRMSIVLSFGCRNGWYVYWGYTKRVQLGIVSLTWYPMDMDAVVAKWAKHADKLQSEDAL